MEYNIIACIKDITMIISTRFFDSKLQNILKSTTKLIQRIPLLQLYSIIYLSGVSSGEGDKIMIIVISF